MTLRSASAQVAPSKTVTIISWTLRLLAAAAFLAAGGAKLVGVPMMVAIFEQIGAGQWFRILTGIVEVSSGVALLISATAAYGALLLSATMVGAILTHIFIIGGSPVPAIALLIVTGTVTWLNRSRFSGFFNALK